MAESFLIGSVGISRIARSFALRCAHTFVDLKKVGAETERPMRYAGRFGTDTVIGHRSAIASRGVSAPGHTLNSFADSVRA